MLRSKFKKKRSARFILWKPQNILKEIKDPSPWKGIRCSWIGKVHGSESLILLSWHRSQINPYENFNCILCRNWQADFKIHMKLKGPRRARTVLKKKNWVRGLTLPDFKTYYRATGIETVSYWPKDPHTAQWDSTGSPEIIPPIYSQLIFKGSK